ncbi:hypothetical protein [Clostridium sp. D53t1_180928_C8]|uniref:hypothetical protein n=1 Tax=Clostridium sp. D53t1_180928_C8 TaxID=2787101 RepID=UPI0018AA4A9C|nr:hypothetical protein [Clostridium sp. D53t1_180928_C8]
MFSINFVNPILVEDIPLIGLVLTVLNNSFGMHIKYPENEIATNKSFDTENFKVTIEAFDYLHNKIFIVYKVEGENLEEEIYSLFLEEGG